MNIDELMKLKAEAKNMSDEEKRQRVTRIESARNEKLSKNVESTKEEYVVLEEGLYDLCNINVALNNVKTRQELESIVDTQGVLDEIESVLEQKTIELGDAEYTDHILTINKLGCVVSKDYYLESSKTVFERQNSSKNMDTKELFEGIGPKKSDCLDDIVPIQFGYRPWNGRVNEDDAPVGTIEEPEYVPYNSGVRFVNFNEFYKGVKELGYDFESMSFGVDDNSFETPFDEYLSLISEGQDYNDIIVEDQDYYKGQSR